MHMLIDPHDFIGQPLFLRLTIIGEETREDDYIVVCADMVVARIIKTPKSFGRHSWDWHITGPHIRAEMGGANGAAGTLDEAKAQVRANFDRWLAWVNVHRDEAVWHA